MIRTLERSAMSADRITGGYREQPEPDMPGCWTAWTPQAAAGRLATKKPPVETRRCAIQWIR
jgi:hypothetical protein